MTEGQIRYQTLAENQRHNLAMERYSKMSSEAAALQARNQERQVAISEAKLPGELMLQEREGKLKRAQEDRAYFQDFKDIASGMKDVLGVIGSIASLFA